MPARVVPDTGDVAVGARLDMPAQSGRSALHEGVGGTAHVGRQGMALLISGKGVLEDRLERDERHRCLRTRGRRLSLGGFLQYHANYPRCKRLVQTGVIGKREGRVLLCGINFALLLIYFYSFLCSLSTIVSLPPQGMTRGRGVVRRGHQAQRYNAMQQVIVSKNEKEEVWVATLTGDLLTECFFKAPDE